MDEFARVLEQLAQGGRTIRGGETVEILPDGYTICTRGTIMVSVGFREGWARVTLTIEDVTEVHRTRSAMEASERPVSGNVQPIAGRAIWVEDWSGVKEKPEELGLPDSQSRVDYIDTHP